MSEKYAQIVELNEEYTIILPDKFSTDKEKVFPALKAIFVNKDSNFVFSGDKTTIYKTIKGQTPTPSIPQPAMSPEQVQALQARAELNRVNRPAPDVRPAGSLAVNLKHLQAQIQAD